MIGPVQSKGTFAAFRSAGVRVRSGPIQMVFTHVEAGEKSVQLGFALSRRFGNAVQRNRARRRMREAFRQVCERSFELPSGSAFLLLAEPTVNQQSFEDLLDSFSSCFSALKRKGAFEC